MGLGRICFISAASQNRLGLSMTGFFVVKIPHDFKEGEYFEVNVGENRRINLR